MGAIELALEVVRKLEGLDAAVGQSEGGAWEREARLARELAAERGMRLDEDSLRYKDVRDLQRLQCHLEHSGRQ